MPEITVLDHCFVPHCSGLLYWPDERLLVVSDMHLEKGSAFASRGQMLPPYDSAATLAKLATGLSRFQPRTLVALGDSFHDPMAFDRLNTVMRDTLISMSRNLTMVWISGNHDPEIPPSLPGERMETLSISSITLRHEPQTEAPGEIAGHLHPVGKVITARGSVRKRAFVSDGARLVMPAFGAYAGGLNIMSPAIQRLFSTPALKAYVCGKSRVFPIEGKLLSAD